MNEANVSNTSVIVHRGTRGLQIMKGLGSISSIKGQGKKRNESFKKS